MPDYTAARKLIIVIIIYLLRKKSNSKKVYMSKTCQARSSTYGSLTRTNKENNLHKLTDSLKNFEQLWSTVLKEKEKSTLTFCSHKKR